MRSEPDIKRGLAGLVSASRSNRDAAESFQDFSGAKRCKSPPSFWSI